MYDSLEKLVEEAKQTGKPLHEIVLKYESLSTEATYDEIKEKLRRSLEVMRSSLQKGITEEIELPIKEAMEHSNKMLSPPIFLSKDIKEAVAWAMAIGEYNSGMGLICAAPTAGSSGVLPATLFKAQELLKKNDEDLLNALLVGSAVGAIIGNKATLSGSEGGCQAEVGVASAMAAASIVHLAGGSPDKVAHSVSLAIINLLGLVCDPVAGLVIVPCIQRNAIGCVNAFLAAELALSGVTSVIPTDEVIEALYTVGKKMPYELKETGLGGIAATPTAKRITKQLFGKKGVKK